MNYGQRSHRRHLPHYQNAFRIYFVTLATLNRFVLPPPARDVVFRHIVGCERYLLRIGLVMPDHVHLVAAPGVGPDGFSEGLGDILKSIKGASSREANLLMGRRGTLWLDESFDHELRRDESVQEKCDYVRQNPVRAGLVDRPEDYPWLWERMDWTG